MDGWMANLASSSFPTHYLKPWALFEAQNTPEIMFFIDSLDLR